MRLHRRAAEDHQRLASVDLRLDAGLVDLRDERLLDREPDRPLALADVLMDRRLRDLGAVVIDERRWIRLAVFRCARRAA